LPGLNTHVLESARAKELIEAVDLARVFACPACLFELAWRIHKGERLHWQTIAATARLDWPEMAPTLELSLVEARMREVHDAEEALRDLRERGSESTVARAAVACLAERMAAEITERMG
jgi:hypothetical protein